MSIEKTLAFVKPGNLQNWAEILVYLDYKLADKVFFERSTPIRIRPIPEKLIRKHYENIKGKSFYEPTIKAYLRCENGIFIATYSGKGIIKAVRQIIGDTDPKKAKPGTIRNVFGHDSFEQAYRERRYLNNIIHAPANRKEAKRELEIWKEYLK